MLGKPLLTYHVHNYEGLAYRNASRRIKHQLTFGFTLWYAWQLPISLVYRGITERHSFLAGLTVDI
jgi:hypothetical protein